MSKRDFFDPRWEDTNVVLIDAPTLRRAERRIKSCETCTPDAAEIPFDWLLDRITGCDPKITDYLLAEAARCPRCNRAVLEKTLVDLRNDDGFGADDNVPHTSLLQSVSAFLISS